MNIYRGIVRAECSDRDQLESLSMDHPGCKAISAKVSEEIVFEAKNDETAIPVAKDIEEDVSENSKWSVELYRTTATGDGPPSEILVYQASG